MFSLKLKSIVVFVSVFFFGGVAFEVNDAALSQVGPRSLRIQWLTADLTNEVLTIRGRINNHVENVHSPVFIGGDVFAITSTNVRGYFFLRVPYDRSYGVITAIVANKNREISPVVIAEFFE